MEGEGQEGKEGYLEKKKKTCQCSEAAERILSDVITTCALNTPLGSVVSPGGSGRFHVPVRRLTHAGAQGFAGRVPGAQVAIRMV